MGGLQLFGAAGSSGAAAPKLKPLGNVSDPFAVDLSEGDVFSLTLVGDASITGLLGIDPGEAYQEVGFIVTMGGEGDYELTVPESWEEGGSLPLSPEVGKKTWIWLAIENGTEVSVVRGPRGEKSTVPGPEGDKGDKGDQGDDGPVGPPGATGRTKDHGEVSGAVAINLAEDTFAHKMLITGDTTIDASAITGWPAGDCQVVLYVDEDAKGKHKITVEGGVIWPPDNKPPTFDLSPGAHNIIPLASPDGGATIYGEKNLLSVEAEGDISGPFHALKVVNLNGKAVGAVVFNDDARLSDARTPTAHAASHQKGGTDPLYLFGDNWSVSSRVENFPAGAAAAASSGSGAAPTLASGRCYLLYFTAPFNLPFSSLLAMSPLITPQFVYTTGFTRLGLMTLTNPDTSEEVAKLVARTAKDTTVGVAQSTVYPLALSNEEGFPSSYNLLRGVRYAMVFFSTAATMGKMIAVRYPATYAGSVNYPPFKVRNIDGQTDIPTGEVGFGKSTTIANSTGDCIWMGAK